MRLPTSLSLVRVVGKPFDATASASYFPVRLASVMFLVDAPCFSSLLTSLVAMNATSFHSRLYSAAYLCSSMIPPWHLRRSWQRWPHEAHDSHDTQEHEEGPH